MSRRHFTTAVYGFPVEKKWRSTCDFSACSAQPWAVIMVRAVSKTSRGREDLETGGIQVVPNISLHYNHSLGPTFHWTVKGESPGSNRFNRSIGLSWHRFEITFGELCHLLSHWCDAHEIVESIWVNPSPKFVAGGSRSKVMLPHCPFSTVA